MTQYTDRKLLDVHNIFQNATACLHRPGFKTTFLLSISVAVLLALNVYQYISGASLRAQIKKSALPSSAPAQSISFANIEETNSPQFDAIITVLRTAAPAIEYMQHETEIYYHNSFIVPTDASSLFHREDCPYYDHADTFYCYNRNNAEYHGYLPCPKCISEDSAVYTLYKVRDNSVSIILDMIYNATESDWIEVAAELQSSAS